MYGGKVYRHKCTALVPSISRRVFSPWFTEMILTYLECAFQDEEFEYFCGSVRPSVQNLKISHAAKRPKAVGLDGPEDPEQYVFTCLTIC